MTAGKDVSRPAEAAAPGTALAGERLQRSIVYGSIATPIKKPDSDHTHKWTIYVRGFHNEDITTYIKRVIIRLHESFQNPTRTLEQLPFEVTETGWGEFVVNIRIVFQDPHQKPLSLVHHLKLYPAAEDASQLKTSRPVVSEHYEELIFDPPTETMAKILRQEPQYLNLKTSARCAECASSSPLALIAVDEQLEREELHRIETAIAQAQAQLAEVEQKTAELTAGAVGTAVPAAPPKPRPRR